MKAGLRASGAARRGATVRPTVDRPLLLAEPDARRQLLLRAFESVEPAPPTWTEADRDWATRVARTSVGPDGDAERFVRERTTQALHRLATREAAVRRLLAAGRPLGPWLLLAAAAAGLAGLLVDQIGSGQNVNLLAPPVWLLVAWNLVVYAALLCAPLLPGMRGPRRWLHGLFQLPVDRSAPLQRFAADWAEACAPAHAARAGALLHTAAAALAAGVIGSLYLRGLVLDYRVGWQSTFLDAAQVQRLLSWLLAPAAAATGIALPDAAVVESLRLQPHAAAQGPAAPWLHLYAATLALLVVLPRLLLALAALLRSGWRARHIAWPAADPWRQRLLAQSPRGRLRAWLLPHARALTAQAALAWRDRLVRLWGDAATLQVAEPLPYGDEDDRSRCTPPEGSTAVLLAVDLATTPEDEVHGRWLDTVAAAAPTLPRVLLADSATLPPERRVPRRQGWQQLATRHGATLLCADDDDATLLRALGGLPAAA